MDVDDRITAEIIVLARRVFGFFPDPDGLVCDAELEAAERALGARLPPSYRALLRYFGAESRCCQEFFGLPRDRLWGDIVLMNDVGCGRLPGLVKFSAADDGAGYYLDTTRADAEGECPVVRWDGGAGKAVVAANFIDFFYQVASGRV